jgi:hypothetical protein
VALMWLKTSRFLPCKKVKLAAVEAFCVPENIKYTVLPSALVQAGTPTAPFFLQMKF